jgi:hypothetical protein
MLFLSFLETKGWMNRDHAFLANQFAQCMVSGGAYHRKVLKPLFFGTLNTSPRNRAARASAFGRIPFLNGGLFNKSALEIHTRHSHFSDEGLGDVFGDLLTRYRFTAREDGKTWTEAAVDPEMLGKAFECLMNSRDRKTTGAFYTPQPLVREATHSAMTYAIVPEIRDRTPVIEALHGSIPPPEFRAKVLHDIENTRVLDPACGSGAFLVHALEELSALRMRMGDLRPAHFIRREVLTRSIFGVDVNPMAVWLCELRLWLSMAIEDPEQDPLRVVPLPNLDRNIRVGDSLSGDGFDVSAVPRGGKKLSALRGRYSRATGPRKKSLGKMLDSLERRYALSAADQRITKLRHDRRELLMMLRSPDLFGARQPPGSETKTNLLALRRELSATRKEMDRLADGGALPFSISIGFADTAAESGFTIITGNPPWVRTHNLDAGAKASLQRRFEVYRNSAWMGGSQAAGAGRGFASQVDASALFVERCVSLLRPNGTLSLILPSKLWHSLAGGGVRNLLQDHMAIRELHDLTAASSIFDAAVYPSILTASRMNRQSLTVRAHKENHVVQWNVPQGDITFDESPGSPWIVAPELARSAFEKVRAKGIPLSSTEIGRPLLGVKTGCNEAFVVSRHVDVEPHLLRKTIRGDQVNAWSIQQSDERIIWTHDGAGPLRELPSAALRWLRQHRTKLERRSDAQRASRWWSLFRTEAADAALPRVVWADIGRTLRAAVIDAGDDAVPLNTCYVARCHDRADALALAAILNSKLATAWLSLIAEPARGGYMRYMGWTLALLPVPGNWCRARTVLVPIAERAADGSPPDSSELLEAVLEAFDLAMADVEQLLAWGIECIR